MISNTHAATTPQLNRNILCVGCGYNLRSLHCASNCPECGIPIQNSLINPSLITPFASAPLTHLEDLTVGLRNARLLLVFQTFITLLTAITLVLHHIYASQPLVWAAYSLGAFSITGLVILALLMPPALSSLWSPAPCSTPTSIPAFLSSSARKIPPTPQSFPIRTGPWAAHVSATLNFTLALSLLTSFTLESHPFTPRIFTIALGIAMPTAIAVIALLISTIVEASADRLEDPSLTRCVRASHMAVTLSAIIMVLALVSFFVGQLPLEFLLAAFFFIWPPLILAAIYAAHRMATRLQSEIDQRTPAPQA